MLFFELFPFFITIVATAIAIALGVTVLVLVLLEVPLGLFYAQRELERRSADFRELSAELRQRRRLHAEAAGRDPCAVSV